MYWRKNRGNLITETGQGASKRLRAVLNRYEIQTILSRLSDIHWLIASLLYGMGVRIREYLRLRIQDIDFKAAGNLHPIRVRIYRQSNDAAGVASDRFS